MTSPTLSIAIIVPVYNGAAYLAEALRSVLAQEDCRISSIIVVDDGSTDSSAAIAAAHPAPVRLIRQSHSGAATARNNGIQAATEDCRRAASQRGCRHCAPIQRWTRRSA
jgi:glycosyltransferase involved in cell wall biosynthesis